MITKIHLSTFFGSHLESTDREAPVVKNCPHDVHVHLNALEPYVTAKWIEPTFKDNIAVTHIIKSKVRPNNSNTF